VVPDVYLDIHTVGAMVRAVSLTARGGGLPQSPTTVRGITLGAPIAQVLERYGDASSLWYTAEGIGFNIDAVAEAVESIVVLPSGTPLP
jgi:hypothetical protein